MEKKIEVINSWDDVSIDMYQQINKIVADVNSEEVEKHIALFKLISGLKDEEVNQISYSTINSILDKAEFLKTEPFSNITEPFKYQGVLYAFDQDLDKMPYGMFVDLKRYLENPIDNLHLIMASMVRPVKKYKYDFSKFKTWHLKDYISKYVLEDYSSVTVKARAELFKGLSIQKAYGVSLFFYLYATAFLKLNLPDYSAVNQQTE